MPKSQPRGKFSRCWCHPSDAVCTWKLQVDDHADWFGADAVEAVEAAAEVRCVKRRYNEFLKLEAELRTQMPDLPEMPPRSLVVRRLNPSFLETRQHRLAELLNAALAADPTLPALRTFLGLDNNASSPCAQCNSTSEQSNESDSDLNVTLDQSTESDSAALTSEQSNESGSDSNVTLEQLTQSDSAGFEMLSLPTSFECPLCGGSFEEKNMRDRHMQFAHGWEVELL